MERQREKCGLDVPFAFRRFNRVARRINRLLGTELLHRTPAALKVEALVYQDSVQPAEELVPRLVALQLLERLDERVLCCVAGVFAVTEHSNSYRERQPLIFSDQRLECRRFPIEAATHERGIIDALLEIHRKRKKVGGQYIYGRGMSLPTWQLRVRRELTENLLIISLSGRLGHQSANLLGEAVAGPEGVGVLVDLAGVDYISSAGLAALSRAAERARVSGRPFALCGVEGSVRLAFELAGLLTALNVQPTRQQALATVEERGRHAGR